MYPAASADKYAVVVHYKIGDSLPEQSIRTIDGQRFRFRDSDKSRHTVLVFLSPWCESYLATTRPAMSANCRSMREQVSALAGDPDTRWLGIASGLWATREDLRQYRAAHGVEIPLTLDESGAMFRSFNVTQVPAALIVDADGRIVRRLEGGDVETADALRLAIQHEP